MKKIYILVLFLMSGFVSVKAQITITRANMPVAGEQFIFSTTPDQINVTATGPNHTWDFSKLQPAMNDTFIYKKPSDISLLYAFAFSGAIGFKQPGAPAGGGQGDVYQFFKSSASTFSQVGMGVNVIAADLPIKYSDEDEVYHFPLEFKRKDSTTFAGNADIPGIGKIIIKGIRITTVDGWGKITTPYKTYNCIRVRSFVREIDSIGNQGIRNDRMEFKWLALEEKIPVFQVIGTVANGQFVQQTAMYRDIYREIINPDAPKADFIVKDTVVFVKDTVPFANLSSGNQNQYMWTVTPNTVTYIMGTSATAPNPVITFNAAGKYTIALRATNRDGSNQLVKTNYIEVKSKTSSISELNNLNAFSVFPNPVTNGLINVQIPENMANASVLIEIMDLQGRKIKENIKAGNSLQFAIDMKDKPKGIYILKITGSDYFISQRIILE